MSVAWPRPVKASEPMSVTSTAATRASAPRSASPAAKAAAAFIGPDRVRRRRADADLEELEDADHRFVRNVLRPSRGPAAPGRRQSMTRFDGIVIPRSDRGRGPDGIENLYHRLRAGRRLQLRQNRNFPCYPLLTGDGGPRGDRIGCMTVLNFS